ncbi:S4 domain-containing protein [Rhodococcus sp. RD6.2]|jgi:hypothetical protein|uniref:S4 domain-containing protein n=1 Tax=Rhodococcus sp. RD6.2 TaxID=260936 RepID=UPI0012ED4D27|nr:S4 domain-containing protein [Rhodococcus sp. RD6.2]
MNDVSACKPVCDALVEQNPGVGRSQAAVLAMEGLVLVNGLPARHPGQVVGPTDRPRHDRRHSDAGETTTRGRHLTRIT